MLTYKTLVTDIPLKFEGTLTIQEVDHLRTTLETLGKKGFEVKGVGLYGNTIVVISQREVSSTTSVYQPGLPL